MKKEVDSKDIPNTVAFQDEFTREFMDSSEEVEEGYYLFNSKTDGYTILWPKNAKNDQSFYEFQANSFEAMQFGYGGKQSDYSYTIRLTYENNSKSNSDVRLQMLSDSVNYKGKYELINHGELNIYFGKDEFSVESSDNRKNTFYDFFSLIKSENTNQIIEFYYSASCNDQENKHCHFDIKEEEKRALKLMKSVQFNQVKK